MKEKRENLFTKIDSSFKAKLKIHCFKRGMKLKDFVRIAVEEKLNKEK